MPEITLQAEKKNFNALMDFVEGTAKKIGFTGSALYKINLAAEEAIINVINYAYPGNKENITVLCEEVAAPQKGLKLQIRDRGIPFDPLAKANPDTKQSIEERPIGGLGIHVIKKSASEVFYTRNNDTNRLTMVFYLPDEKKK